MWYLYHIGKDYSTEYFYNSKVHVHAHVAGLSEILSTEKISAIR